MKRSWASCSSLDSEFMANLWRSGLWLSFNVVARTVCRIRIWKQNSSESEILPKHQNWRWRLNYDQFFDKPASMTALSKCRYQGLSTKGSEVVTSHSIMFKNVFPARHHSIKKSTNKSLFIFDELLRVYTCKVTCFLRWYPFYKSSLNSQNMNSILDNCIKRLRITPSVQSSAKKTMSA